MRTLAAVLLSSLHQLALSVWMGGIVVLGAVAAPAPFKAAKAQGATHWGMPLYDFAGTAAGLMFGRFNAVVLICGMLLLVAGLAYGSLADLCRVRVRVRAALTLAALAIAGYVTVALYPQMLEIRQAGDMQAFDALHHTYSAWFRGQLALLLGVTALTGWMHLDGRRYAAGQPGESGSQRDGLGERENGRTGDVPPQAHPHSSLPLSYSDR